MKAMYRSLASWQMIVMRLAGAVPDDDAYFVRQMYRKIVVEEKPPFEAEAIRLETLADKYRAAI